MQIIHEKAKKSEVKKRKKKVKFPSRHPKIIVSLSTHLIKNLNRHKCNTLKRNLEELLHGVPVEENAAKDTHMPDVVAPTEPVEEPGVPALRDLHGVDECTSEVYRNLNTQRIS